MTATDPKPLPWHTLLRIYHWIADTDPASRCARLRRHLAAGRPAPTYTPLPPRRGGQNLAINPSNAEVSRGQNDE